MGELGPHPWHCSTAPLPWFPRLQPKFQPLHVPTVLIPPCSPGRQAGPEPPGQEGFLSQPMTPFPSQPPQFPLRVYLCVLWPRCHG